MTIRRVRLEDAPKICSIYNHYVTHSVCTFEEEPVSVSEMEKRIREVLSSYPWLVWEDAGEILGYTYSSRWKSRSAYRYSTELSVYVRNGYHGQGIGKTLMASLLDELQRQGFHAVIGGIVLPNERSVRLHERFGFQKVAHFSEVGFKFGKWLDVGYWQRILS
ncbi:MAG: GNAT family N-acetyltransferase [Spirochaetes bacterium]|nr:GNAT family N-acetyltransferase [Spirochaetota bacterium]